MRNGISQKDYLAALSCTDSKQHVQDFELWRFLAYGVA